MVWVTDSITGQDVAESTATAVGTNGLVINNPAIEPLACETQSAPQAWCAAHPQAWFFGTQANSLFPPPAGNQVITVTFGDGAMTQIPNPIYDGYNLPCNQGWSYQADLPTFTAFISADIYFDCANSVIDFPHGAVLAAMPKTYPPVNSMAPQFLTILSAVSLGSTPPTQFPFSSVQSGQIYVMATGDGGFAKVYLDAISPTGGLNSVNGTPLGMLAGFSLHAQHDGSYAF